MTEWQNNYPPGMVPGEESDSKRDQSEDDDYWAWLFRAHGWKENYEREPTDREN